MLFSRRSLFLAATLVAVAPAFAAEGPAPYLTAKQVDLTILLPPPPEAGSALDEAEIAAAAAIQRNATPERIALANADAKETIYDMFGRLLGDKFKPENLAKANVFFERALTSEDEVTDPAKKVFGRVRPYMATPDIKALVPASKSGSYPSGHTTRVTLAAVLMDGMLPEKRAAIWARADEYAASRIVGGMHYPSDIEAGRRAGTAMAAVMMVDPAVRADYEVAKAEVRAALGL